MTRAGTANVNVSSVCCLAHLPGYTAGSQYEAMECFLNECMWLHTKPASRPLFFLQSIPWLLCDLGSKRPHNYKSRERRNREETVLFLLQPLKSEIYRILHWLLFSNNIFSKSIEKICWSQSLDNDLKNSALNYDGDFVFMYKKGITLGHWDKQQQTSNQMHSSVFSTWEVHGKCFTFLSNQMCGLVIPLFYKHNTHVGQ